MSLFQQLSQARKHGRKVSVSLGELATEQEINAGAEAVRSISDDRIEFTVFALTSEEGRVIDAITSDITPPPVIEHLPNPNGVGMIEQRTGWDHEDPSYRTQLQDIFPKKQAYMALLGCPDLQESTPGDDLEAKAIALLEQLPGTVISLISNEVQRIVFHYEGIEEVFTSAGLSDSPSSKKSDSAEDPADKNSGPPSESSKTYSPG